MNDLFLQTPAVLLPEQLLLMKPRPGARHVFGGKGLAVFKKWKSNDPSPQLVFTLDLNDPKIGLNRTGLKIPLYFPFQLDGATLDYDLDEMGGISNWTTNGKPAKDWPYKNFPPIFPTQTFEISKSEPIDWKMLEKDDDWMGITFQDSRPASGELLVVFPSCKSVGDVLWGPDGYSAGVQTIFRIRLNDLKISAWTEID